MSETLTAEKASTPDLKLPVKPRLARALVLAAVFLCAACGLVYELALVALGSFLIGDSVTQAAIVISIMVFAMGVGSLAAKPLSRWPEVSFAIVEGVLAIVGGLSVLALYAAFAWLDLYQPALIIFSFIIGLLIGAEIPILMTLLQKIRKQDASSAVADLFAADYIGALIGGIAFPLLLLPVFGQIKGALLVGALNAVAGMAVVLWLFRKTLSKKIIASLSLGLTVVLGILGFAWFSSASFEVNARQALYDAAISYHQQTPYQEIVLTKDRALTGEEDMRLFLNGDLQFSSVDEYRYHESLVHPAMTGPHQRVLILGGGDGLALREVLKYPDVEHVTKIELDPAMIELARTDPSLSELNQHAYKDPRVNVVNQDAFVWLQEQTDTYDTIIVDMPDPDAVATAKLYSNEFYTMVGNLLVENGQMVVQSGSPYFAPNAFWCIKQTVESAGFKVTPYQIDVPSFGNWGFVLASKQQEPKVTVDPSVETKFLTQDVLTAAQIFPKDRSERPTQVSTLIKPSIMQYENKEWKNY